MPTKIKMSLTEKSIDNALEKLTNYQNRLPEKAHELAKRLADLGAEKVTFGFSTALYDGDKDVEVFVDETDTGFVIIAMGDPVAFIEFGVGVTFGAGHPYNDKFGMGPGTYPSDKGHWNDPNGWWVPISAGGFHTYGNPPNMPMYNTAKDLANEIQRIALEVFHS